MSTLTAIEITAAGQQKIGFETDEQGCRDIVGLPTVALHEDDEMVTFLLWTGHVMLYVHRWLDEATAISVATSVAAALQANVTPETWNDIDAHLGLVAAAAAEATSLTPFETLGVPGSSIEATLVALGVAAEPAA